MPGALLCFHAVQRLSISHYPCLLDKRAGALLASAQFGALRSLSIDRLGRSLMLALKQLGTRLVELTLRDEHFGDHDPTVDLDRLVRVRALPVMPSLQTLSCEFGELELGAWSRWFVNGPLLTALTSLRVEGCLIYGANDATDRGRAGEFLSVLGRMSWLRRLELYNALYERGLSGPIPLAPLTRLAAGLERLALEYVYFDDSPGSLGPALLASMSRLTSLRVDFGPPADTCTKQAFFAVAPPPTLRRLELVFWSNLASLGTGALQTWAAQYTALERLVLRNCGCQALSAAALLPRLTSLAVRYDDTPEDCLLNDYLGGCEAYEDGTDEVDEHGLFWRLCRPHLVSIPHLEFHFGTFLRRDPTLLVLPGALPPALMTRPMLIGATARREVRDDAKSTRYSYHDIAMTSLVDLRRRLRRQRRNLSISLEEEIV